MSSPTRQSDERSDGWFEWIRNAAGVGVVLTEIAGIYLLLLSLDVPDSVAYGGTVATAIVVGGSSLYVASRSAFASDSPDTPTDKSDFRRVTEVIVSVSVLTAVTAILGSIGGLGLTVLAKLGGPDPKTADGELLRNRLLSWVQQNRDFMRDNGSGTLPLKP